MTIKHTPGPWKYDDIWALVNGPKGQEICAIHAHETKYDDRVTRNEAQANAQFIVRACNAHEELRGNLKAACNVIELLLPLIAPSNDRWSETGLTDNGRAEVQAHLAEFKVAIAKAEGKE